MVWGIQSPSPKFSGPQDDALPFPVCISATFLNDNGDPQPPSDVSMAFGNVVLADHGLSFPTQPLPVVPQPRLKLPPNLNVDRCQLSGPATAPVRYRPQIPDSPLTQAVPLTTTALTNIGSPQTTSIVPLTPGVVSLANSSGFNCLTLRTTNPAGWPQYFGVLATVIRGIRRTSISPLYTTRLGSRVQCRWSC